MPRTDDVESRLYHVHTHLSDLEKGRLVFEIVALTLAAVWACYVFFYQERIKPAGLPAYVESSASVTHQLLGTKTEFVNVTVILRNLGATSADLDGIAVNVFGFRVLDHTRERTQSYPRLPGNFDVYRTLDLTKPTLLRSYYRTWLPFGGRGTLHIPEGGSTPISFWFVIPRGQYNVVSLHYRYCFTKTADRRTYHANPSHHVTNGPYYLPDTFQNDLPTSETGYRCLLAAGGMNAQGFPL